ncbi:MAG: carboxymuconolactone decarboxylase family protein [Limnochordaceae bacterium]|nr:carboxymuconolactone decarboxylase family protein [Limnochordaceae bacterium]
MGELGRAIPGTMQGFQALHDAAVREGALSPKMKELIALGIAIAVHCEGCIACHVHDALQHGASREEIAETVGVAVMMGGGPSVVYGSMAMAAVEQFQGPK